MTHIGQDRIHLRVVGHVQGVGFRWFVLADARRRGLRGWVRNNHDGSVELEAEGPAADLNGFRDRVREGPPAARVQHLVDLPVTSEELPQPFQVKR